MNILVTGGCGFIGSHIVDALVEKGYTVRVLDNFDAQVHGGKNPDYLNPKAEYIYGDVRKKEDIIKALDGIEAVYHEASSVGVGQSMYEIHSYVDNNSLGTAQLLDVIVNKKMRLKKLVVASSMSVYGEGLYQCETCGPVMPSLRPETQLKKKQWEVQCPRCAKELTPCPTPETKPLRPTSIYSISKQNQEDMCLCIGKAYNIPSVALRYFNVYGPRQALSNPYTGVCAMFSSRIKNDNGPIIYEDGLQSRDFIYVSDVVAANIFVLENDALMHEVVNVGRGEPTAIKDIAVLLSALYGKKDIEPILDGNFRAGDIRHCYADMSKMASFGFKPQVTLKEGLEKLVAWGKSVEAIDKVQDAHDELSKYGLVRE